jgi:cell division protein FtsN
MAKRQSDKGPSTTSGRWSSLLAKLFGWLLLSAFMFTVGVFVGRGTAPVQFDIPDLQERLKSLRETAYREAVKLYKIERDTTDDKHPLKYREVLRKPADPAAGIKKAPQAVTAKNPPSSKKDAASPSTERNDSGRGYLLQVASMKDGEAAAKLVEKLKQRGHPAYRESITMPDSGMWYRVRVGDYADRDAVEKARAALGPMGQSSMIISK